MTVAELLPLIQAGTAVRVEQVPIKVMDSCKPPVLRQYADVETLSASKQNYLDFEVDCLCQVSGALTVRCKANAEQEMATVSAWHSGH